MALMLGVVWGWSYLRDRPVRSSLDRADAAYAGMLASLASARDLGDVRSAAQQAARAAEVTAQAASDIQGHHGDLAEAALDVVRGQHDVAAAAARLTELTDDRLAVWGEAESALGDARSDLAVARTALAGVDKDAARSVQDPAKAIDNVRGVVGAAATRVVTRSVTQLVDRLGQVTRTAQVRKVAADAAEEGAVVRAALVGLSGDSATAVQAAGAVFDQLALLRPLDADHLSAWDEVRVTLVAALGEVAGEVDGRQAFRASANDAVDNLDGLVASGQAAMQQWHTDLARAKRKQARAQQTVATYREAVQEQLTTYQQLRSDLSDFFTQVDDAKVVPGVPPAGLDARAVLGDAYRARQDVLGALKGIEVPPVLESAHAEVERVVKEAGDAVKAAYDALGKDYYCDTCVYADSPSYLTFSSESERITGEFTTADTAWHEAVTAVRKSISDKALPKKPVI
jgi:hypothetical protein